MDLSKSYWGLQVANLVESAYNPRRTFKGMDDLTESVRTHGVLVPLIVRKAGKKGKFEVVAGARRLRAAREAGLTEVPCVVRDMSDAEALEVQVLENLQREEVPPLDEAFGYRALIERNGYDADALAAKMGKSKTYIYQRMKLADLTEPARAALEQDRITFSHALHIARLPPGQQETALRYCFGYYSAGTGEIGEDDEVNASVSELAEFIRNRLFCDLSRAAFAGGVWAWDGGRECKSCPKRTGSSPSLFIDIGEEDICTDEGCFREKLLAYRQHMVSAHPDYVKIHRCYSSQPIGLLSHEYREVEIGDPDCGHVEKAVVIDESADAGEVREICRDRTCPVHWAVPKDDTASPAELSESKKKHLHAMDALRRETAVRSAILAAITPKVMVQKDVTPFDGALILDYMIAFSDAAGLDKAVRAFFPGLAPESGLISRADIREHLSSGGIPPARRFALAAHICLTRLAHVCYGEDGRPEMLVAAARRYGLTDEQLADIEAGASAGEE
jgi:ParB family chromosome partitioning protein